MAELTYRYRLYPTDKQAAEIRRICGCTRFLYNKLLEDKTKHFRETKQWKKLNPEPYLALPFMKTADLKALSWTTGDLERAYRNFFHILNTQENRYRPEARKTASEDPTYVLMDTDLMGYPRFKKKKATSESYTTYLDDLEIKNKRILLPSVGEVKIRLHRPIPTEAEQVCCTVLKKSSGEYYLAIQLKFPDAQQVEKLEKPVGIVFAEGRLAVRSDEVPIVYRHQDKKTTQRITKARRALKRRTPGSKGYEEMRIHLAKLYEHRSNQRKDDLHKAARQIANAGDAFYVQKPGVKERLARMDSSAKKVQQQDEAWWTFSTMIQYKVKNEGKRYWGVPTAYPLNSLCSCCDYKVKEDRQEKWVCPNCGVEMDLALNAARNLMNLGFTYIEGLKSAT